MTLFEGPKKLASEVSRFLKSERLEFLCFDIALRYHDTNQRDLLAPIGEIPLPPPPRQSQSVLIQPYRWREGIEERAAELMKRLAANGV